MNRVVVALVVTLALLAALVGWQLAESRADVARLDAVLAAGKVREAQALARYDSLSVAQRHRDRTTTRLLTRWDTVRAGVDTLLAHDTVTVTRDVMRYVTLTADSTIKACLLGRATCEERVQAQAERADALAGQRDAIAGQLRAEQRSAWWGKVGALGVGAVAGLLLARR